jgi:alkylated DNA nucleotide flippase Atl1
MKSRKSWHEKMNRPAKVVDIPPAMQKRMGPGKMLLPCPLDVDALIRTVRRGRLVTQSQIRETLAHAHQADVACPITTGIFVRIAAEAAEQDLRAGKKRVTPYWRVVRDDGTLNEKLKRQAARLRDEGYAIEPGSRKNTLRVRDFRNHLISL